MSADDEIHAIHSKHQLVIRWEVKWKENVIKYPMVVAQIVE